MIQGVINYGPAKCAYCNGLGNYKNREGTDVRCVVCRGNGSVLVAQPAWRCVYCNGKGGFRDNDEYDKCFVTCDACEGSGWAYELREK